MQDKHRASYSHGKKKCEERKLGRKKENEEKKRKRRWAFQKNIGANLNNLPRAKAGIILIIT